MNDGLKSLLILITVTIDTIKILPNIIKIFPFIFEEIFFIKIKSVLPVTQHASFSL